MATAVSNADIDVDATSSLAQRVTAEMFGTFLLVGGVIGTALFSSGNTGILGVALAVGLAVIGGAYAVGHISGGHFNPAVTLGAAASGRFAWRDVPYYVLAQIIGGALATTVLFVIATNGPAGALQGFIDGGFASNGFGEHSPGGYGRTACLIAEIVFTFGFLFVILGSTHGSAPKGFAPIAIGLCLTLIHLISIPVTNTSVNPARSTGPALFVGDWALSQLWLFWVAPLIGAVLAGVIYRWVGGEEPARVPVTGK